MTNGWTKERRERQALLIHRWKPWLVARGPTSQAGKQAVSQNALKHGCRSRPGIEEAKQLRAMLTAMAEFTQAVNEEHPAIIKKSP